MQSAAGAEDKAAVTGGGCHQIGDCPVQAIVPGFRITLVAYAGKQGRVDVAHQAKIIPVFCFYFRNVQAGGRFDALQAVESGGGNMGTFNCRAAATWDCQAGRRCCPTKFGDI